MLRRDSDEAAPAALPRLTGWRIGVVTSAANPKLAVFFGAGLAGMLFGHGFAPVGLSPGGAALGLLLQLALIGGLVWLGLRMLRRY